MATDKSTEEEIVEEDEGTNGKHRKASLVRDGDAVFRVSVGGTLIAETSRRGAVFNLLRAAVPGLVVEKVQRMKMVEPPEPEPEPAKSK